MVCLSGLGGAGLAADAVALHGGVLTGAAVYYLLQNSPAPLTGPFADHLPYLGGFGMLEHVAVGVGDLAHHIGLHQVSAVDHGGGSGDEL